MGLLRMAGLTNAMLEIFLLGPPQLHWSGETFRLAGRPKTLPLLAYLLLQRHSTLSREHVAFALWPDVREEEALANLRRHLHGLARALPRTSPAHSWVIVTRRSLQWNPAAPFRLDVAEFERLNVEQESWAEAVALYRGELLEGVEDEEWLYPERERLRNQFLTCLENLILDCHRRRDYLHAIAYARRLLACEPYQESALRRLIILRYESGDRAGALQDYEAFVRRLWQELQAEPMPETQALREAMLREEVLPTALSPSPASPVTSARVQSLPLPFAGRAQEMEALQARWHQARQGEGGLVLLGGEAGIGKSRLAAEFASRVEAEGGRMLKGHTTAGEPLPYQALLTALRPALPLLSSLTLDPLRAAAIAPVLPDWPPASPVAPSAASRASSLPPEDQPARKTPPLERLDPEREQLRLFDALASLLEGLARPRPLLLIMEDLHLAGSATWALVEFISLRALRHRLLLLGTYRVEEMEHEHPLRETRRRLQAAGRLLHLTLAPLKLPAIRAMVEGYANLLSKADLAAYVYDRSGGNPFFAAEALQDLLEASETGEREERLLTAALPEATRALLSGRLARLHSEARTLAGVAAVCGMAFDVELLTEMTGWGEAQVLDNIETLLDRRLLREAGGEFTYTFGHHLMREAIYADLSASERRRYHRRAARLLPELFPARGDELAAAIAEHWEQCGEGQRAARWYLRAARHALSLYADREAQRWLDRGLTWASDPALRFDLLALREEVLARAAEPQAQQSDLNEMEQLAAMLQDAEREYRYLQRRVLFHRARGQREQEAEALRALRARAAAHPRRETEALEAESVHAMLVGQYGQARQGLQQALAHHRAQADSAAQATCLCLLAEVAIQQGAFTEAESLLQQATTLAQWQPNRFTIFRTTQTAARAAFARQDFAKAQLLSRQALELAQALGDRAGEADASLQLATAHARLFDVPAAEAAYGQAAHLYQALNRPQGQAATLVNTATLYINLGRYPQAQEAFEEAERLFAQIQDRRGQAVCAINRSVVAHYQANYAAARTLAARGLEWAQAIESRPLQAVALIAVGAAERELGELSRALEHLQAGLSLRRDLGQTADLCHDLIDLVETHLRLQGLEAARAAMEEMLTLYRSTPTGILQPQAVLWAAAKACRALGETARAAALLVEARAVLEAKAAAIPNEEARRAFLDLPFNRQLQAD